jgi:cell cycle arrest protein BUB3
VTNGETQVMSTHTSGVKSVVYSKQYNILVSAAWDSTLHIHLGGIPGDSDQRPAKIELPSKPHALDLSTTKLVVVMASRALYIYELSSLSQALKSSAGQDLAVLKTEPWQHRESSLKFMTRAVSCMPNDEGYATSSIEGRVAVEWFDPSNDSQARKYAFKCHRQPVDDVDVVYPVNSIAFHPIHGTFATGGGDGVVAIWDAVAKRRIRIYPKLPSSIAGLSFSSDGKYLATAISPGFEDGKDELAEGTVGVYLRELGENEVKRKAK